MNTEMKLFKFLFYVWLPIVIIGARSMNEPKIELRGSVYAVLAPYGFQQCARECEDSGRCEAFDFERSDLSCMLIWAGLFTTRFESPYRTFDSQSRKVYGKYAPGSTPSSPTCTRDSKVIRTHDGKAHCMKVCPHPPLLDFAYMITDGEDYTKPGTLLQYRCYDGLLKFHGGTITCLTSGHWSDFGSPLGCSIYGDSTCMNDNDCADVTMSKCRDGLCVCMENHMRYDKTKNACVTGCESFSGSAEQEYSVKPNGIDTLKVWCKQGWTVIHNRQSGNVNFEAKTWSDYKYGFGDILGDYWIGLDKLHLLTQTGATVRLHMVFDTMENMTLTHYDFKVGKESTNYTMHVSSNFDSSLDMSPSFSGLYSSSGAAFYTTDRESYWACASTYGAWWYIHFVTCNCWVNIRGMNGEFDSMLIRYLESNQSNIINFNVETVNIAIRLF